MYQDQIEPISLVEDLATTKASLSFLLLLKLQKIVSINQFYPVTNTSLIFENTEYSYQIYLLLLPYFLFTFDGKR